MRARFAILLIPAFVAATVISTAAATPTTARSVAPTAVHAVQTPASMEPTQTPTQTPTPTPTPTPAVTPTSTPTPTPDLTPKQAVASVVAMINRDRSDAGLRPLRLDPRMASIAQVRADTMAREDRMSHVSANGTSVFDLIDQRHITWYFAGEIIAWNNWPTLADSGAAANRGWMGSPQHHEIIVSSEYNYVGVALAVTPSGGRYWSVDFLRGPDRTAPQAKATASTLGAAYNLANGAVRRRVTWRWTGGDIPLATLTAGLRKFQVERRVDDRPWVLVAQTSSHALTGWARRGHVTEIRVRGIDRAGNVGAWSAPIAVEF